MRTFTHRETIPASTLTETDILELKIRNHSSITLVAHSASTNVRLKVKYVFEEPNGATGTRADIKTIDLAQDVLSVTNFDMKLTHLVVTRDDTGSPCSGGALKVDITAVK